jgi:hypothetical protein
MMEWWLWLVVVGVAVAIVAVVAAVIAAKRRRQRTARLRERFGREYDRALKAAGGRRGGEAELEERLERHRGLQLAPADTGRQAEYEQDWKEIEQQFEAAELPALARADALVTQVLADRGYPMESFDQRVADLSVDYPDEVGHYRRARAAYRRADEGQAAEEELYEALQHYRAFLDTLLAAEASLGRAGVEDRDLDGRREERARSR